MTNVILVIHVLAAIAIVVLVLLQQGRGADMGRDHHVVADHEGELVLVDRVALAGLYEGHSGAEIGADVLAVKPLAGHVRVATALLRGLGRLRLAGSDGRADQRSDGQMGNFSRDMK